MEDNKKKSKQEPSGSTSMMFFVVLTIIFFVMKYSFYGDSTSTMIWSIIYMGMLIFGQFYINLLETNKRCGDGQWGIAFMVTLIPWLIIFGLLNLLLMAFPGWLIPFSNTFGYLVAKLSGINKVFIGILKKEPWGSAAKPLAEIYKDKSLLINQIGRGDSKFDEFWNTMEKGGLIDTSASEGGPTLDDLKKELKKLVELKFIVAEFIWYILTGALVTAASQNYLLGTQCSQSVSEMQKRNAQYQEQEKQRRADEQGNVQRVYTSYE